MSLGEVFSGLMELFLHQNELMWSRIKILLTIEGFVLSSGYYLRKMWVGLTIMFLSIFIIFAIYIIFLRDEKYRDQNKELMLYIGNHILEKDIGIDKLKHNGIPQKIDFNVPPLYYDIRGSSIFKFLFFIIIIINYITSIMYFHNILP